MANGHGGSRVGSRKKSKQGADSLLTSIQNYFCFSRRTVVVVPMRLAE